MAQSFTGEPDCLSLREVLGELSEITDWCSLGILLGVPKPTLSVFEQQFPGDVQQCKIEMIDYWLLNSDNPSWSDIISAVEEMGMLSPSLRKKDPSSTLGSEVKNKLTSIHSVSQVESKEVPKKELSFETKCTKSSFNFLFRLVFLAVRDSGVTAGEFVLYLREMKALEPVHVYSHVPLLAAVLPTLYTVSNLAEVFDVLRGYCSWFNYHLLEWIIKAYCPRDQRVKRAQQVFDEELRKCYKHRVCVLPKNHFGFEKRRSSSMIVKCNEEWETMRVELLMHICQSIAEILKIKKRTLYLISVEENEGSIALNFSLPPFAANAIFPLTDEQQFEFRESLITSLKCGPQHYRLLKHTEERLTRSRARAPPRRIIKYSPGGFTYNPIYNSSQREDQLSDEQEWPKNEFVASYSTYEEPQYEQRRVCTRSRRLLAAIGIITIIMITVVITVAVLASVFGRHTQ